MSSDQGPKVPVGPTTVVGYSVTLGAAALAILAYLNGDRSEQTLGTLAAGVLAALAFLTTQIGRYAQAKILAQKAPVSSVVQNYTQLEPIKAVAGFVEPRLDDGPGIGDPEEPYDEPDDLDPADEQRDLHDADEALAEESRGGSAHVEGY